MLRGRGDKTKRARERRAASPCVSSVSGAPGAFSAPRQRAGFAQRASDGEAHVAAVRFAGSCGAAPQRHAKLALSSKPSESTPNLLARSPA